MEAKITSTAEGVLIDVEDLDGKQEKLLEAFQECSEGRCTCPTQEYQKVESMEVAVLDGAIQLTILAKPDQKIDTAEIEKCLEYTQKRVAK